MYFSRVRIRPTILKSSQLGRVLEGNANGSHRLLWDLFSENKKRTFLYREEIAREQLGPLPVVRGEPIYYLLSQTKPVEPQDSLFKVESKDYRPRLEIGQRLGFDCRVNPIISKAGKKHDVVMNAQLQLLSSLVKELRLEHLLSANTNKSDNKKLLLAEGGNLLNQRLNELLANNPLYAERLHQITSLSGKLEWVLKAHVDTALENWLKKQGERLGFNLVYDNYGFCKLQNSGYLWHSLPEKAKKKGDKSGFSTVDFTGELEITDDEKFKQTLFQGIGRAKAYGCGLMLIRRL